MKPILLHIPHASLHIPEEAKADFVIGPPELQKELLRLTDRFTDELFELDLAERLVFGVSRLVVDPERFEDDSREPMAARGMGAVYMKTTWGAPLRHGRHRESLISTYYTPHHEQLDTWADQALQTYGRCLLIDCHSFPSKPLPCDLDQTEPRPMFCIGTDDSHTPSFLTHELVALLSELAETAGQRGFDDSLPTVLVDRPYSGTMVPSRFYGSEPRVQSIMIEINRSLYMNELTGAKLSCFTELKASLARVLGTIAAAWETHAF